MLLTLERGCNNNGGHDPGGSNDTIVIPNGCSGKDPSRWGARTVGGGRDPRAIDQDRRRPGGSRGQAGPGTRRSVDVRRHAVVDRQPDGTWTVAVPALGVRVTGATEPQAWAGLSPAITALLDDPEGRRRLAAFAADHAEEDPELANVIDLSVTDALAPLPRIDGETLERAVDGGDPILVVFWSDHARACRDLGPELVALVEELAGRVQVARLNVDEHPGAAATYRVRGLPTVVLFRYGREARRIVGACSRHELLAALAPALP